jgi:hypothetical protein
MTWQHLELAAEKGRRLLDNWSWSQDQELWNPK